MKIFARALAVLLPLAPISAAAQSSPGLSYGQVPTAGQWNSYFASKQDLLRFTPLNQAGGTMTGKFQAAPSTINGAGFAILPGVAPQNPVNGDIWATNSGLFVRAGGVTMTFPNLASIAITGGSINGTTIGSSVPASGAFTTLSATTPLPVASGGTGYSSLSAALDAAFGATQGGILYRGAAAWTLLGPGTSGQYLATGGAGANPSWGTPSGAGNVSTSGTITTGTLALFASSTSVQSATAAQARVAAGLNSAGSVSFRNRLINGHFAINQRGAAAGSTSYAAGSYVMDRWKAGAGGVTLNFAASANGDVAINITAGTLLQVVEGGLYLPEGGSYTASWTGTSTCRAYQGTATGSYVASPFTTSAWTAGTNGTVECSTGTLTLAQFEAGTQATTFERRDDELRRAQRYYEAGTYSILGSTSAANGFISGQISFKNTKRATPTVTQIASSGPNVSGGGSIVANGPDGATVYAQSTASGNAQLTGTWTAQSEL